MSILRYQARYTQEQWDIIEQKAKAKNVSVAQFLSNEITRKMYSLQGCQPCSGLAVKRMVRDIPIILTDEYHEKVRCLAAKNGMKECVFVSRIVVDDLVR